MGQNFLDVHHLYKVPTKNGMIFRFIVVKKETDKTGQFYFSFYAVFPFILSAAFINDIAGIKLDLVPHFIFDSLCESSW